VAFLASGGAAALTGQSVGHRRWARPSVAQHHRRIGLSPAVGTSSRPRALPPVAVASHWTGRRAGGRGPIRRTPSTVSKWFWPSRRRPHRRSFSPVTPCRSSSRHPVSAFVEGLLPERNLRSHIASQAGVHATDTMSLLERVGAEYAGAVQILPQGRRSGRRPCAQAQQPGDHHIGRRFADLPLARAARHLRRPWPAYRTRCCWWRCPAWPHTQRRCGARTCRIPRRILLSTVTDRSLE